MYYRQQEWCIFSVRWLDTPPSCPTTHSSVLKFAYYLLKSKRCIRRANILIMGGKDGYRGVDTPPNMHLSGYRKAAQLLMYKKRSIVYKLLFIETNQFLTLFQGGKETFFKCILFLLS